MLQRATTRNGEPFPDVLKQQVKKAEAPLPVSGLRVLQVFINQLERTRERDAQTTHDFWDAELRLCTEAEVERRSGGELIKDGL